MFEIEQDIPIPPRRGGPSATKYPLADMHTGDSFFVPIEEGEKPTTVRARVQNVVGKFRKRVDSSTKFTVRAVDGGLRIWRTK